MGNVKLNEPGRQKLGKVQKPCKQAQHRKQYSDLTTGLEKEETFHSTGLLERVTDNFVLGIDGQTDTDRQTDRRIDRRTDGRTDGRAGRQAGRQIDRSTDTDRQTDRQTDT